MEHTWAKVVGLLLTPFRITGLLPCSVTGETQVPPIHNVLDPPAKKAAKAAREKDQRAYLEHLERLAASGGHGVDLSKMSPAEIRARLFGN
jgi:hypothetical protein